MSWLDNSHWILAILVSLLWLAGFSFLIFKPDKKYASWIPAALLGLFIVGLGADLFLINRDLGGAQKLWARGWIGPHDQDGAITIGVLEDTIGLTAALFSALLALILCSNHWIARREQNSERIHAGLLMGVGGISVAWLSLTPWLSLLGISLAALGGFVMLGAQGDAELMEIFGIEKTAGFVLSLTGAAVLAGGRGALSLEKNFVLASTAIPHGYDVLGGVLLFLGLFVQAQPVPFLGWLIRAPKISSVSSTVGAQIFPALAALGLAVRFEPELRSLGMFPVFQWLAISSAILTVFCGLAQENWKTALPMWLSSSFSLVFAALCFSGPSVAFPVFLGAAISAASISLLASAREAGIFSVKTRNWFRPLLGLAAAGAVGFIGFVSSGAMARLFSQSARNPADAVALALTLLFVQLLFWKAFFSVWATPAPKNETQPAHSVAPVAWSAVLLLVSLGLIWTGEATGGVIPHDVDRLFSSWFSVIFGSAAGEWGDESALALGEGLLWAAVALAGGLGLWFFPRGQDSPASFFEGSPKLRDFLGSGYRVDRVGSLVLRAIRSTGNFTETWIGEKISIQWVPKVIERAFRFPARWLDNADREIYAREESLLRKWVEVPAKALQLVQNGDLQWYLIFGIGTMIALLVHFVRA